MTKDEIAELIERVASLPEMAQAELIDSISDIETRYTGVYRLNDDERAAVERGFQDLRAGRLVSDEEMAAFWRRHGV